MTFKQELIDINGVGKKIANKIVNYAFTKEILIQKLTNNYDEMIDLFRDDVVEKLLLKFIRAESVSIKEANKDETPEIHKQDVEKILDIKSLSRFIRVNKKKIQYDCPKCGSYIQISIGDKCPICYHKI